MSIQIHECTPYLPSCDIGRHRPLILKNHMEQQATLHVGLWRFLCPNGHIRPVTRLENMPCDGRLLLRHSPEQNREEGIDAVTTAPTAVAIAVTAPLFTFSQS